ncbi:BAH domain-containing protein [Pochonia chlamydosporia 170]|uniref:BAH domain-containing protein n=1 Tax=Pochonia chlamydosporia 170 TaxID=1380566 RepID=A0A179F0J9_METCM|nr:BAH domain-containing protein [Pochonia chlamydosporia 170]OAQ58987.2 BAH domain-containing protein [Pochonia chlamydosporia 170]
MVSKVGRRRRAKNHENTADCPFKVTRVLVPPDEKLHYATTQGRVDSRGRLERLQQSPFDPPGAFKSHRTMNLSYSIAPHKPWYEMRRYNSFVRVKFLVDDFVYVSNDTTIERQMGTTNDLDQLDYWVAKILEIRASDEYHVYARIYWMYSPDDLPRDVLDGDNLVGERRYIYSQNELVASNHMDIINVVSVVGKADVPEFGQKDDDKIQSGLYWRRAFDYLTSQLSSVDPTNKCEDSRVPTTSTVQLAPCEGQLPPLRPTIPVPDQSTNTPCTFGVSDHSASSGWKTGDNAADNEAARTNNDRHGRRRRRRKKIIAPASMSLFRLYRQSPTQQKLLAQLQSVLEAACYEFGKRSMPDIFHRHGWDSAESLELNRCAREFQHWTFSDVAPANRPRDELFRSISNIRHTVVHRLRVSVDDIEKFYNDAETLLLLLGDDIRRREIARLRQESQAIIAKAKKNKHPSHSTVGKSLLVLATQKAHEHSERWIKGEHEGRK